MDLNSGPLVRKLDVSPSPQALHVAIQIHGLVVVFRPFDVLDITSLLKGKDAFQPLRHQVSMERKRCFWTRTRLISSVSSSLIWLPVCR